MNSTVKAILLIMFLAQFLPVSAAGQAPQNIDVDEVNEEPAPPRILLRHAIPRLGGIHSVVVCFESAWPSDDPAVITTDIEDAEVQKKIHALLSEAREFTLEETLDRLVNIAPEYTWQEDEKTKTINFFPKKGSRLQRMIEHVQIKDMSVRPIVFNQEDVFELEELNIGFSPGRGNLAWYDNEINLEIKNVTTMQALNMWAYRFYPIVNVRWEVYPIGNSPNAKGVIMLWPGPRRMEQKSEQYLRMRILEIDEGDILPDPQETAALAFFDPRHARQYYPKANPDALPFLYGIINNRFNLDYHGNAARIIGHIGGPEDVGELRQVFDSFGEELNPRFHNDILYGICEAWAVMARRGIKEADEEIRKWCAYQKWDEGFGDMRTQMKYEYAWWTISIFGAYGDADSRALHNDLIESIEDPRLRRRFNLVLSGDLSTHIEPPGGRETGRVTVEERE